MVTTFKVKIGVRICPLLRGRGRYIAAMNKTRLGLLALLLAAVFLIGSFAGSLVARWRAQSDGRKVYNTATILKQVQSLNELVTVKFVIEKVVVLEDVKWYGESRVLILAHGIVKSGVDLNRLKPDDISVQGAKITVKLPPAQVLDAYLDDKQTQIIERTTGLLRTFDKDLEQTARQNAVDDIRRAARLGGINKDADEKARQQLEQLFRQAGFTEVEFR